MKHDVFPFKFKATTRDKSPLNGSSEEWGGGERGEGKEEKNFRFKREIKGILQKQKFINALRVTNSLNFYQAINMTRIEGGGEIRKGRKASLVKAEGHHPSHTRYQ